MKTIINALFIIVMCLAGYAQNTIKGVITDTQNNPLFGVEIYTPELHIGTTSDKNGKYELSNLPNGNARIVFSYIGFETKTKNINLTHDLTINIVLNEAIFNIDEVIISTPFNKLQADNVMKVEFAKIKTLKQKGVPTLIEGLETIAGVTQISTGTAIGKPVIRGLSGNRVLVYAQGVRLENQQFGDEHGLGINLSGIESVEVIKGPASLLYGSDALGGVLYFNPEKFAPNNSFKGDFSQQYFNNTQGSSTSIGLKKSGNDWKFLIRGTYDSHIDYKISNQKRVTNTRYNETNFNTGIGYHNRSFFSELRYNYNRSNIGLTEGIETQSTDRKPQLPFQKIDNHIVSLHNHIYLNDSKIDLDFGYIFNDRSEYEDTKNESTLHIKLKTFNYDVKYHLPKMKRVEMIIGLQGMSQTNKNSGDEILIPNAKIYNIGIFTTGILEFEKSAIQVGIRFDNRKITTSKHEAIHDNEIHLFESINKKYSNFTASFGYKFNVIEKLTTRINLATGFRAPNLAELTSNGIHHGTNRFEIGNQNLSNEQNFQTDISFEYENKHFEFFVNGFYNKLNDYIYLNPTGAIEDNAAVFTYTQENVKLYGGEIGIHLHPHPIHWLHIESSFETVIGKQNNNNYLPLIPANKWSNTLRTSFDLKNWLSNGFTAITISNTFKQQNTSQFETTTYGYTLVNIGTGGKIHLKKLDFELNINATNLFNTAYTSHLSRLKSEKIDNIGRNIVIGVTFEF